MRGNRRIKLDLSESDDYVLHLNRLEPPLDVEAVFGRRAPLEIEIGCGKGLFLVSEAARHPERDFIGIEVASKYYRWTLSLVAREKLTNVRVLGDEAEYFIDRYIGPGMVDRFHVYYPDPWPKRRHRKRRIFKPEFLKAVHERLVPGGLLRVATDHEDYYRQMQSVIEGASGFETSNDEIHWENWLTNFGRKYEKEGRAVYRECLVRGPGEVSPKNAAPVQEELDGRPA